MKEEAAELGIKAALKLLRTNPHKGALALMKASDVMAHGEFPAQRDAIRKRIQEPDSPLMQYVTRLLNSIDGDVLDTIFTNFFVNANMKGWPIQCEMREKYGCNIPWAILLDPTSACNLHCAGCWAADYGNRLNLSLEDIDSIIEQGKALGTYVYIYTGGEPLVRKRDVIILCEKHPDCVFLCFTNGTLIDEAFCEDMLRVKNFIPAISVEGDETTTDGRRGEGVYSKVQNAMRLLRENKLPFAISCCYTRANMEAVSSPEYFDQMAEWGAIFTWYFHYMPVGSDADVNLICTPEQRREMYYRVRRLREEKPLFAMDFQNDGQYVQGCIAGGRRYLHINAAGDVDPCVFIHFSDTNIHEHTLLEALQAPLFMAYHDGQPFNDNHLRPCPMLENPHMIKEMVERTGAHSSNLEGHETVDALCARCEQYAREWKPVADELWAADHHVGEFSR